MMNWWNGLDTLHKWVYGYLALTLAVGILGAAFVGPGESTPKPPKPPKPQAERTLTDAEVEAKWNEQLDAAKRGVNEAARGVGDAWEAAKRKAKRTWIEGQDKQ